MLICGCSGRRCVWGGGSCAPQIVAVELWRLAPSVFGLWVVWLPSLLCSVVGITLVGGGRRCNGGRGYHRVASDAEGRRGVKGGGKNENNIAKQAG